MKKIYHSIRFFLLVILTFALVSACSDNAPKEYAYSDTRSPSSECRLIEHGMGETCVPINPQRVIALTTSDVYTVLALGVKPVGGHLRKSELPNVKDKLEGVENIGQPSTPNLEKIAFLKPDLILGWGGEEVYDQMSQIAPTVLKDWEHNGKWKEMLMFYAEVLGRTGKAGQLMRDYYQRIEEFQQQMGERLKEIEVSVIRIQPGAFAIDLRQSFPGTIIEDAGLRRPPAQREDGFELQNLSKERIADADGDVIFVWTYGSRSDIAQEAQSALARLKADPLWQNLDAVQEGKVYEVPAYWIGGSIETAHLILDDLFKYLINEKR